MDAADTHVARSVSMLSSAPAFISTQCRLLHGLSRTLRFRPRLDKWPGARLVQEVLNEDLPLAPGGPDLIQSQWAP